jgi:hypothetical protein
MDLFRDSYNYIIINMKMQYKYLLFIKNLQFPAAARGVGAPRKPGDWLAPAISVPSSSEPLW